MDIPWGATVKQAEVVMADRPGVKGTGAGESWLTYRGGGFSGLPATRWTLGFADGRFTVGSVLLEGVKKPMFDWLQAQLSAKYGEPTLEKRGDGRECRWDFRGGGRSAVRLEYERPGKMTVTYSHDGTAPVPRQSERSDL